ncbi:MAG: ABC-type sugar transport system, ATPase component protein, partial [Bryobacterales bacterium]|nr:ABC-type sugar transport system, ATPase component protein [Bryobacterales bacterium]
MLLELRNVQKRFGGVTALRDGNLSVAAGEVHLLLGENGAGKSTLMKIVAGIVSRDSGNMFWNGQEVFLETPAEAAAIGIAMVNQESLLASHLTVAENIFLGREKKHPFGWVKRRAAIEDARQLIEQYGFPLSPDALVGSLSPAGRQMVEICRAIRHGSSLLIFDEPTSSLSDTETQQVFRIVRDLKSRGMGIIYITHRMDELRQIGDRVTVLRDGGTVHTGNLADIPTDQLIRHMVGREVAHIYEREHLEPGETALEVRDLHVTATRLRKISFCLRKGEITGMAGLIGAGRTELCRAIFGVDELASGEILVNGAVARIRSPRDAVRAGIALVTEDRQVSGLALSLSIAANMTLANVERISRFGFLDFAAQNRLCTELGARMSLKASSTAQGAGTLSGGNQQKVVIAKWLFRQAQVFLFDEPTRGIDIGAKAEVFELMSELARQGAAILMVSSELAELQHVADRILVMRQGRISGEVQRGASQEQIMKLAV